MQHFVANTDAISVWCSTQMKSQIKLLQLCLLDVGSFDSASIEWKVVEKKNETKRFRTNPITFRGREFRSHNNSIIQLCAQTSDNALQPEQRDSFFFAISFTEFGVRRISAALCLYHPPTNLPYKMRDSAFNAFCMQCRYVGARLSVCVSVCACV